MFMEVMKQTGVAKQTLGVQRGMKVWDILVPV
jgi:hypothetical protein